MTQKLPLQIHANLPGDLERSLATFIDHYNHRRCHESPDNLTPEDVYFGPGQRKLDVRMEVKRKTIEKRCRRHSEMAARTQTRWYGNLLRSDDQLSRNP